MFPVRCKSCGKLLTVLLSGFGLASPASALQVSAGIGDELRYTDNAALSEVNEQDDLINTVTLSAGIAEQGGATQLSLNSALRAIDYTRDTFDNVNYLTANANASWQMVKGRLNWNLVDTFRQQRISSLDPDTPTNTQDINVFSFGPDITIPLTTAQQLTIQPQYRRTYYEVSAADNQQYVLGANWQYRWRKAVSLVVDGSASKVAYDVPVFDFESRSIDAGIAGSVSRSDYALSAGVSNIKRDTGASQRGNNLNASWQFNASQTFTFGVTASSRFTEAGNVLLNAALLSSDATSFQQSESDTLQIATGVVRIKSLGLNLNKTFKRLVMRFSAGVRRSDYDGATSDRDVRSATLGLRYNHSARLSSRLDVRYNHTRLNDGSREDTTRITTLNLNYNLSRRISATARLSAHRRDSTVPTNAYDENSFSLGLSYQY